MCYGRAVLYGKKEKLLKPPPRISTMMKYSPLGLESQRAKQTT